MRDLGFLALCLAVTALEACSTGDTASNGAPHPGMAASSSGGPDAAVDTLVSCYDGPPGTEGVGPCKAGTKAAGADGVGVGPCVGEVTPALDLCSTPEDEDCNGTSTPCVIESGWAHTYPVASGQGQPFGHPFGLGVDAADNVVLGLAGAGIVVDGTSFPTGSVIVKHDSTGDVVWAKPLPPSADGGAIAVHADGTIFVCGGFSSELDLGLGPITCSGLCTFAAAFDPSGAPSWIWTKESEHDNRCSSIAVDSGGSVYVGGHLAPLDDGLRAYVARLDASGQELWTWDSGNTRAKVTDVATGSADDVAVVGWFDGTLNLFGSHLGEGDFFAAKLDVEGKVLFTKRISGGAGATISTAIDPAGDMLLTGVFFDDIDFGAGSILADDTEGQGFLAKLDTSGDVVHARAFGRGIGLAVTSNAAGEALFTGGFEGHGDFGVALESAGGNDVFVARYNASGDTLSPAAYGDAQHQVGWLIAPSASGFPVVAGAFRGTLDFGSGPIQADAGVFVAKIIH